MIHYVPDPVEIEEPIEADIFFCGGGYKFLAERNIVTFTMSSPSLVFHFDYKIDGLVSSPIYMTVDADKVHGLMKETLYTVGEHSSPMDWGQDAGQEILDHIQWWLKPHLNIEIDLTELRKQVAT